MSVLADPTDPYFYHPTIKLMVPSIWETREGNVMSKCIVIGIWPVFAQNPIAPIQDQKARNDHKKFPTDRPHLIRQSHISALWTTERVQNVCILNITL